MNVEMNVPSSTCVTRSLMKLRRTREPYCCDAMESATDASEKVTLAAVIIDPAMVLRRDRAPSGPPPYAQANAAFVPGSALRST